MNKRLQRVVCLATLVAQSVCVAAHAQIVAAPEAPPGQRPLVTTAPNGVPLVQIQTPSAAGVSRNVYSQFDVQARGAILNNSAVDTRTQLSGWVPGNQALGGTGPARIILNEVRSAQPSHLRGPIEVAGMRAEVVVANPAGIVVNGGGFINASRATLTTGEPRFNAQGGLDGFVVRRGSVRIEGAGLDASDTDYAAILARAVELNAGVWAKQLKLVAGAHSASADHERITPEPGEGVPPAFALDVAALGGMYAGKIHLIGTEQGLGVRNAGHLGAGPGEIIVTAAGRLENRGTLEAARLQIAAEGDIRNLGTLRQTADLALTVRAAQLRNDAGSLIGADPTPPALPPAPTGEATGPGPAPTAGFITSGGTLANDGGRILLHQGSELAIHTGRLNNAAGAEIHAGALRIEATDGLVNRGLIDGKDVRIGATTLTNIGTGRIYGDRLSIGTTALNNLPETADGVARAATLAARERLDIGTTTLSNREGALIFSAGDLAIGGALDAQGRATGRSRDIVNHAATIEALGAIRIDVDRLNNTAANASWTLQPGEPRRSVEYSVPDDPGRRWPADQVLFASGGLWPDWGGWRAISAADPYGAGTNADWRLLLPAPEYPLARFAAYYAQSPAHSADRSVESCNAEGHCTTHTTPGAWYAASDPIWATFGVAPPPDHNPLDVNAHRALDAATGAFITTMTGGALGPGEEPRPSRFRGVYDAFDLTTRTDVPVLQSLAPGRIVAGGAIAIDLASGLNDMSQILAGGALNVTGGRILNQGLSVDVPLEQSGTAIHSYLHSHTFGADERRYQPAPYQLTTHATAELSAARREGHVQVPGGGATVPPPRDLPTASLFTLNPQPGSRFLVETDPRFTQGRSWITSDVLLEQLGQPAVDAGAARQRLGDGFHEQRWVQQQIAHLTGQRYLGEYQSDLEQYAALLNAGATFAQEYHLTPGIALTAEQMAQLTSDIVWLVEQDVVLPDGSTRRVLAPQVYVRPREGDLHSSGALLAGRSVQLRLEEDLLNAGGTIAGREVVAINAQNIRQLGGRITGKDVALVARDDIEIAGGRIDAQQALVALAGRDVRIVSTTRDAQSTASGVDLAATTRDRIAGLYVSNPGGSLTVAAGRDLRIAGAEIRSAGDARLIAGRDLDLGTLTTGRSESIRWSDRNARQTLQTQEIGSTLSAAGDLQLQAGRDLTARAAALGAGHRLDLEAGGHIDLQAGEHQSSAQTRHSTRSGMSYSRLDTQRRQTTLAPTTLAASEVRIRSGGDATLSAVEVQADRLDIVAGGQVRLPVQMTVDAQSLQSARGSATYAGASGRGRVDERAHYNRFDVAALNIQADGGIHAQRSASDTLAALGQEPGMAWVNQLATDPALARSTTWNTVQEEHSKWAYHQRGMGPVTAAVVTLVVGVATAGAGTAAVGTAGTATSAGTGMAGAMGMSAQTAAFATGAMQAGITALTSQATISLVNNQGDIGRVLDELGRSDSVKNLVAAMLTGGVLHGMGMDSMGRPIPNGGAQTFGTQLQQNLTAGAARAVIDSAVRGTSLEDALKDGIKGALLDTVAAQGAFAIGEAGPEGNRSLNAFAAEAAHAIAGCAIGVGRADSGDGCSPGAIGAVLGHLTARFVNPSGDPRLTTETILVSQTMGGIAAAIMTGDASAMRIAESAAGNAVANNRLLHPDERALARRLAQQSGGRYTTEQIEAQMRLMGNLVSRTEPNHAEVYDVRDAGEFQQLQDGIAKDPSMPRSASGNTVYEVLGAPDASVQAYIVASTREGSNWIPGSSPYVPSAVGAGEVRIGSAAQASTDRCANGDLSCLSGVGAQQNAPLTPEQMKAAGAYFGKVSSDYQRAAALATAAGNVPVAASFEIAAGVAGLLEQVFVPSLGKVAIDVLIVDELAKDFSTRSRMPLFVVNEVVEREIKPRLQDLRSVLDNVVQGQP